MSTLGLIKFKNVGEAGNNSILYNSISLHIFSGLLFFVAITTPTFDKTLNIVLIPPPVVK